MSKWISLVKYDFKIHKYSHFLFMLGSFVVIFLFMELLIGSILNVSKEECDQFKEYMTFTPESQLDAEENNRDPFTEETKRTNQFLKTLVQNGNRELEHFAMEMNPQDVKAEDGFVYFYSKNYKFNKGNLVAQKGFSGAENELIEVNGTHKIGDLVSVFVNGEQKEFKVVDIVKNHVLITASEGSAIYYNNLDNNIYLVNPQIYDSTEWYYDSGFDYFYIKADNWNQKALQELTSYGSLKKYDYTIDRQLLLKSYKQSKQFLPVVLLLWGIYLIIDKLYLIWNRDVIGYNFGSFNLSQKMLFLIADHLPAFMLSWLIVNFLLCFKENLSYVIVGFKYGIPLFLTYIAACFLISVISLSAGAVEQDSRFVVKQHTTSDKNTMDGE